MINGATRYPSRAQLNKLQKEYDKQVKKKDLAVKYDTSIVNIINVLKNNRCSEKVYNKLFNS